MKKVGIVVLLALGLFSCGQKKDVITENKEVNTESSEMIEKEKEILYTLNDEDKKNIETLRSEITLDNVDKIFFNNEQENYTNSLEKVGANFLKDLYSVKEDKINENINGGIKYSSFEKVMESVDEDLKRDFIVNLNITNYKTKQKIKKGTIYINNVNVGEFSEGTFDGTFKWIKGIEVLNIVVRAEGYGDGIYKTNSVNSNGDLIMADIKLKKAKVEKVNLSENVKLNYDRFDIEVDKCTLVTKDGSCYTGEATSRINFVSGEEANESKLTLDLKAIDSQTGELFYLKSGGMAFTDFYTDEGEILKIGKNKSIKITYKVSKEEIENMLDEDFSDPETNGYWVYNKVSGLWEMKAAKYAVDEEKLTFTATVNEIY